MSSRGANGEDSETDATGGCRHGSREAIESRLDRQIYETTVGEETRQRGGLIEAVSGFLEEL